MPINPQVQALLDEFSKQGLPPFDQMSVTQARLVALGLPRSAGRAGRLGEVRDILVPGPAGTLPVRLYHPSPGKALPLVVYFHGGGWVIGDLEIVDKPCRALANASRCVVASVNYRLSPETKFPGPAEDCYAATRWLAEHAARHRRRRPRFVAVAGDSAGGNLAAAVALMARDRGGPAIAYQLLIYPVTAPAEGTTFASYRENARRLPADQRQHGVVLGPLSGVAPDDGKNPYASPLHASDSEATCRPPWSSPRSSTRCAMKVSAYARRLQEAGVKVKSSHYDGMIHGFFWMAGALDRGKELIAEMGKELRQQVRCLSRDRPMRPERTYWLGRLCHE